MKSHRHASQLCDLQPVAPRLHATHTHITLYTRIVQIVPGLYAIVVVAISFRGKGMALLGGWTTASFGERRLAPSATFQRLFINWLECCIFCFSIIFFFFHLLFRLIFCTFCHGVCSARQWQHCPFPTTDRMEQSRKISGRLLLHHGYARQTATASRSRTKPAIAPPHQLNENNGKKNIAS